MRLRARCSGVLLAASLAACGGERDATDKQLGELRAEIARLRAGQAALAERLDNAELSRGVFRGAAKGGADAPAAEGPPPPSPRGDGDRPNLDVVRLQPEGDVSDDPNSDAPRPVVRAIGNGGSVQGGAKGKIAGGGSAQDDYDRALELFKGRSWDRAIEAFSGFLSKYPDNPAIESATFLRAESYFAKNDARRAAEQYEAVASSFPQGSKAPEALLRATQAYARLGDKAGGDAARKKLLSNYPASDAAKKLAKLPSDKKKP